MTADSLLRLWGFGSITSTSPSACACPSLRFGIVALGPGDCLVRQQFFGPWGFVSRRGAQVYISRARVCEARGVTGLLLSGGGDEVLVLLEEGGRASRVRGYGLMDGCVFARDLQFVFFFFVTHHDGPLLAGRGVVVVRMGVSRQFCRLELAPL